VSLAFRSGLESADAAEDAVQEAFLALYSELARGGAVRCPKGWTYCVLRRQIIKFRRQEIRHRDACLALSYLAATAPPDSAAYLDFDLVGFLSVLTAREAEILRMRASPMRYAEIASALAISVNTVKTLLARATRKMQDAARRRYPESLQVPRRQAVLPAPPSPHHPRRLAASS
jgi:RNA polymerase sigma factor (sigma-70 family)